MRKYLKAILFLAAAVALMSVTALAADGEGIIDVKTYTEAVTVTPLKADDTPAEKNEAGVYEGAVKVKVQYTGANSSAYYLILAQNAEGTPTDKNIVYIDQGELGKATFTVYPSSLTTGTYYIYLSSTGSAKTQIASFKYYQPYTLGDVNGDKEIDVSDAMAVINHIVKKSTLTGNNLLAADVVSDGSGKASIDVSDAMAIINYIVKKISSF